MVIHGNRLEDLRDVLLAYLRRHPLGPLESDVVLVQSNGMKHWLELALASDDALGICAGTEMSLPATFLWQTYRRVLGAAQVPVHMPYDKQRLMWRLVGQLPQWIAQHACYEPLRHYLGDTPDGVRLYELAEQIADVFDGYQSYRPDWLAEWARGADTLDRQALGSDQRWQAQLWRDIRSSMPTPRRDAHRYAVHDAFLAALRGWQGRGPDGGTNALQQADAVGIPRRVVVFGISSLPWQVVEALAALGQVAEVLMLVQNPCRHHWAELVDTLAVPQARPLAGALPDTTRKPQRAWRLPSARQAEGAAVVQSGQPLLAAWGKQGRDYLHLLDRFDELERYAHRFQRVDVFTDPVEQASHAGQRPTVLQQLQSTFLDLGAPLPDSAADSSIECVTTHSMQREVEVLHDRILQWLDDDPGLQPGDIMVMVPDIVPFVPHIQAVFGRHARHEPCHVPFSVADVGVRQSPVVRVLEQLCALPDARLTLSDWHDAFELPEVRQRFGLDEAQVEQLHEWLQQASVRWGVDSAHRQAQGMRADEAARAQNTWWAGLRQLLLGYAGGEPLVWQGVQATPAWASLDAPCANALLAWLDAVELTREQLTSMLAPVAWVQRCTDLLARFFRPADDAQERALALLQAPLQDWLAACEDAELTQPLPWTLLRTHWLASLSQPRLHQRFFGGGVQFGTLMPMRAIPFRVVCLLGMNDGAYPRMAQRRDFDLISQSWRPGDRSRREDDRYLFLEALLAARDKLYISWQGSRATDQAPMQPSVLVAQLLDYLAHGWPQWPRPKAQPLQPFSQAYLRPDSGFRTYGAEWMLARQPLAPEPSARVEPSTDSLHAVPARTAMADTHARTMAELTQLLRQPVEVYFRHHLRLHLDEPAADADDTEPFALDALTQYRLTQRLLLASDRPAAAQSLRLSGELPLAARGSRVLDDLLRQADVVQQHASLWLDAHPFVLPPQPLVLAGPGWMLSGTLADVRVRAEADASPSANHGGTESPTSSLTTQSCVRVVLRPGALWEGSGASRLPRLSALVAVWVEHVCGCAAGLRLTSVVAGLDEALALPPLHATQAQDVLNTLVAAWHSASTQLPRVAARTAWVWLHASGLDQAHDQAHDQARAALEGTGRRVGEWQRSPYLQRAFDGYADMADDLPDWACRLYGPLAQAVAAGQQEGAA